MKNESYHGTPLPNRYELIDEQNAASFLLHEPWGAEVGHSVHSLGLSRELALARTVLAGNMSPLGSYGPQSLAREEKITDAKANLARYFAVNNIDPSTVRILHPERDYTTPLTSIAIDETQTAPDDAGLERSLTAGDLMYTYNPDIVLAARPADCPIVLMTADTPRGQMTSLLHLAWLGAAHGYVEQAKAIYDGLGVDWDSARCYITAGGQAETFTFEGFNKYNPLEEFPDRAGLFVNVTQDANNGTYAFGVDSPKFVYDEVINRFGIDPYQVYLDTSDTTSPRSGYSSHSRSFKGYPEDGSNTRDIVYIARANASTELTE